MQDTPDPRITRANKEAASYRTQLREAQKQNQELEAKFQKLTEGLALLAGGDKPAATPEEQLAAAQAERDAAHAKLQEYALNNAVQAAATKAGVDPKLVLPLLKGTGGLDGLDPNSDTFTTTIAERLDALATQFPQVKPQPAKSSGQPQKDYTPESGAGYLTLDDVRRLNEAGDYAAVNKAMREGKIRY